MIGVVPHLLDPSGRPVSSSALRSVVAGPEEQGVRTLFSQPRVLGALSLSQLGSVIRSAERGDVRDLQSFAGTVERRDLHVLSVLQTRRLAVLQAPWIVTPADGVSGGEEHASMVSEAMNLSSWTDMLYTLSDANYRGYAVSEIMWDMSESQWMPLRFEERDQRWMQWDKFGHLRLRDNSPDGAELPAFKFLEHRAPTLAGRPQLGGLMYPISAYYMYKQFSLRDWMAFAEIFGMPIRVGRHKHGASIEDVNTLQRAVQSIGSDAGAVIPEHMDLELLGVSSGNSGGGALYKALLEWVDKAISKGVLGQTMTSEDGSSEAQALVHQNVRYDILRADTERISKTVQEQMVRPLIDLNFGPQESYPQIAAAVREPEDLTPIVDAAVKLVTLGLPVKMADLYRLTGFSPPDEGDKVLTAPAQPSPAASGQPDQSSSPDAPRSPAE